MIYVFENTNNLASIIYRGETLTDEQKKQAVAIEYLPEQEKIIGKVAVLKVSKAENRVWYEYQDEPKNNEVEQLKQAVADLIEIVLMGGM